MADVIHMALWTGPHKTVAEPLCGAAKLVEPANDPRVVTCESCLAAMKRINAGEVDPPVGN